MTPGRFALFAASYLAGSIPTGYWLGKLWKGIDVRKFGSGNLGATNVFRVLGVGAGIFTLSIDILKGLAPVIAAKIFFPGDLTSAMIAGLAAILGHTTSMFVHFRGGKGMATAHGVFFALMPLPSAISLTVFFIVLGATRYVSLGSITGALTMVVTTFALSAPRPLCAMATIVALFVTWKHRANIKRLMHGTENRVVWNKRAS